MRKYISLILLITILFISNGYYLFFKYFQHSINKEIKQEIRKGINEEELSIFVIPINEVENIKWTKKDKEFIYKGLMYDVVKSKIVNNKKYYYCINDSKEDKLVTYSDFKYTSSEIDPVYTDTNYVLTTPPEDGQYLPNSPKHQLYVELGYKINRHFKLSLGTEYQSEWAIYTDSKAYNGELDPKIYQNWQEGFNLYNARLTYNLRIKGMKAELSLSARNFTRESYMAFTEPDPDGNSYQPGPKQEFFGNIKLIF